MGTTYQYVDIKLQSTQPEDGLMEITRVIRPSWKEKDAVIKILPGGTVNKLFGIHLKSDTNLDDGIVIRINGEARSAVGCDRDIELRTLLALNSKGYGVKVLGSFKNGIILEYLKGQYLSEDQMRDKHIISLVATELTRMHTNLPLDIDPRKDPLYVTKTTFENVPKKFKDPGTQAKYAANILYEDLKTENLALHEHLLSQNMEVAICHGDLWQENIMYDPEKDSVTFIDYEQSGYQFAAWDIAFDFLSLAGSPPDFKNQNPSDDVRKFFIQQYLNEKLKITESETVTTDVYEKRFRKLYVEVRKCELLALLHLVNQCLYCGTILDRDNDFDFMSMAIDSWNEYKKRKDKTMTIKPEDVFIHTNIPS